MCYICQTKLVTSVNHEELVPHNLYWWDDKMFVSQNSAHNVLNNVVCRLFLLICTGYNVLHCI